MSCGIGRRCGSDPVLLWLLCRPVATAPIRSLVWEPPYAVGVALEKAKRQKKKEFRRVPTVAQWISGVLGEVGYRFDSGPAQRFKNLALL